MANAIYEQDGYDETWETGEIYDVIANTESLYWGALEAIEDIETVDEAGEALQEWGEDRIYIGADFDWKQVDWGKVAYDLKDGELV